MKSNANVVLELTGPDSPLLISAKVVRCRAASLGDVLTYEAACAFKRPLTFPERTVTPATAQRAVSVTAEPSDGWRKVVHDSMTDVSCAAIRTIPSVQGTAAPLEQSTTP